MTKASLEIFIRSLNDASARYLVCGDYAVAGHGAIPSSTVVELLVPPEETNRRMTAKLVSRQNASEVLELSLREYAAFDGAFQRAIHLELSPGTLIPVCGYTDLVTLKRDSTCSADTVDLHYLEMVQREMTNPTLQKDDPWVTCTFDGNELSRLVEWAALPFSAKVARMEQMQALNMAFLKCRQRMGLRSILPRGEFV